MFQALVLAVTVAGIALTWWVSRWARDRNAQRRGESRERSRRASRRSRLALLAYFVGGVGCELLASALGANGDQAAGVAGAWQIAFLVFLIIYAIQRRREQQPIDAATAPERRPRRASR